MQARPHSLASACMTILSFGLEENNKVLLKDFVLLLERLAVLVLFGIRTVLLSYKLGLTTIPINFAAIARYPLVIAFLP